MQRHGWTLLFHDCLVEQLDRLAAAAGVVSEPEPLNANAKLLLALRHAMFDVVPSNPGADVHRQGNTLGKSAPALAPDQDRPTVPAVLPI